MSNLRDLQSAIGAMALDRGSADPVLGFLADDRPIPAAARLRIHRNNTLSGLIDPLAATFPVVRQLVGEEFFERLAGDFIRAEPPTRPDLLAYGQSFPSFVAHYGAAASVPYLADMARLEFAINIAYHAVDHAPMPVASLQRFAPEQLESLRLSVHPSLRFIGSDYPLLAIWQAHQPGGDLDQPIALDQSADRLLVYRPRQEVLLRSVDAGAFSFVMTLATGQSLAAAYEAALEIAPGFEVMTAFADLLAAEIFVEAFAP